MKVSKFKLALSQWGIFFGFLSGFCFTIIHAFYIMRLGLTMTVFVAFLHLFFVLCGILANLWLMAGQPIVLQALAHFEPTSCFMEWLQVYLANSFP